MDLEKQLQQEIEAHRKTEMRRDELHGLLIAERQQKKALEEAVREGYRRVH